MIRQTVDRREWPRGTGTTEPLRPQLESMILGMYHEMPGLSLQVPQAALLFGLRGKTCQIVLDDLVAQHQLARAADGQYIRRAGGRPLSGAR
jgi:hypothetical protein